MKSPSSVFLTTSVFLCLSAFLSTPRISAQQAGHYIGEATGLDNGSTAPPGFFATFLPLVKSESAAPAELL